MENVDCIDDAKGASEAAEAHACVPPNRQWQSRSVDALLLLPDILPKKQRAWERQPRTTADGRTIWKRYSPRPRNGANDKAPARQPSPGKVLKKLCLNRSSVSNEDTQEGGRKQRFGVAAAWDRRRSGLRHKTSSLYKVKTTPPEASTRSKSNVATGCEDKQYGFKDVRDGTPEISDNQDATRQKQDIVARAEVQDAVSEDEWQIWETHSDSCAQKQKNTCEDESSGDETAFSEAHLKIQARAVVVPLDSQRIAHEARRKGDAVAETPTTGVEDVINPDVLILEPHVLHDADRLVNHHSVESKGDPKPETEQAIPSTIQDREDAVVQFSNSTRYSDIAKQLTIRRALEMEERTSNTNTMLVNSILAKADKADPVLPLVSHDLEKALQFISPTPRSSTEERLASPRVHISDVNLGLRLAICEHEVDNQTTSLLPMEARDTVENGFSVDVSILCESNKSDLLDAVEEDVRAEGLSSNTEHALSSCADDDPAVGTGLSQPEDDTDTIDMEDTSTTKIQLNDDADVLREFLSGVEAAKIAKRSSLSHRRDSNAVKQALVSPRKALDELDRNSPSPNKLHGSKEVAAASPPKPTDEEVHGLCPTEERTTCEIHSRRSARTRKMTDIDPSSMTVNPIPLRLSNENLLLKRSDAQMLGDMTRANTRRNKGGALSAKLTLLKLKGVTPEVVAQAEVNDAKAGRTVQWDEQLVGFFEAAEKSESSVSFQRQNLELLAVRSRLNLRRMRGSMNCTPMKPRSKAANDANAAPEDVVPVQAVDEVHKRGSRRRAIPTPSESKVVRAAIENKENEAMKVKENKGGEDLAYKGSRGRSLVPEVSFGTRS